MIHIHKMSDFQTLEICPISPSVTGNAGEFGLLNNLSAKRRREFLTGRHAAARGLRALGCGDAEVGVHQDRSPIWPDGYCGSISHSDRLCAVTVAQKSHILSQGIDIEQRGAVDPEMATLICQPFDDTVNLDPVTIFSAKEAYYKLWYPLVGEFLDFTDVSIRKGTGTTIIATLQHKISPTPRLICVTGCMKYVDNHVMTFFALAKKDGPLSLDPLAIAHDLV
ncbi:MAG: 4'-phosphopantetheinyl transferase superfamily protein [Pseudoruegeria sp.]